MSLEEDYFEQIYAPGESIDGDHNARAHAQYLYHLLQLVQVEVGSLADFGCGKGRLLYELLRIFAPRRVVAIDSSQYAIRYLRQQSWLQKYSLKPKRQDLVDFSVPKRAFDLGVCNSVLQYVEEAEVKTIIAKLAHSCRYLYLHVPCQEDYEILQQQLDFSDPWAKARPVQFYESLLQPYFVRVSWGLWESRALVSPERSAFFDRLYRS